MNFSKVIDLQFLIKINLSSFNLKTRIYLFKILISIKPPQFTIKFHKIFPKNPIKDKQNKIYPPPINSNKDNKQNLINLVLDRLKKI